MSSAHPGFSAVQAKIANKQGISSEAAGAILAKSTRNASAKPTCPTWTRTPVAWIDG